MTFYLFRFFLFAGILFGAERTYATQICVGIDGPANRRTQPNGKIVESLPSLSTVWTDYPWKIQNSWFQIRFARLSTKAPIRCSNLGDRVNVGWIHVKNINNYFVPEFKTALDTVWDMKFDWKSNRSRYSGKLNQTCVCAQTDSPYHDGGELNQLEFLSGDQLSGECVLNKRFMSCELYRAYSRSNRIVCPLTCLEVKIQPRLTSKDRNNKLIEVGKLLKTQLLTKLGESFMKELENKYPNWIPLVVPHPKQNNGFLYELNPISSWGRFVFSYQKVKKERSVLIFFTSTSDAEAQKPAIAFEGNENHVEFRMIPFSIQPTKKDGMDEDSPFFCIGTSGELTVIKACRFQDEITPVVGYGETPPLKSVIDFRSHPVTRMSVSDALSGLGIEETSCCISPSKKISNFESLDLK